MGSSIMRILLRIARAVLEQVKSQISAQISRIEDEVISEMNKLVSEVDGGGTWKGGGAGAFVAAVKDENIPFCNDIVDSVTQINTDLNSAVNIIEQADRTASNVVKTLRDQFESI